MSEENKIKFYTLSDIENFILNKFQFNQTPIDQTQEKDKQKKYKSMLPAIDMTNSIFRITKVNTIILILNRIQLNCDPNIILYQHMNNVYVLFEIINSFPVIINNIKCDHFNKNYNNIVLYHKNLRNMLTHHSKKFDFQMYGYMKDNQININIDIEYYYISSKDNKNPHLQSSSYITQSLEDLYAINIEYKLLHEYNSAINNIKNIYINDIIYSNVIYVASLYQKNLNERIGTQQIYISNKEIYLTYDYANTKNKTIISSKDNVLYINNDLFTSLNINDSTFIIYNYTKFIKQQIFCIFSKVGSIGIITSTEIDGSRLFFFNILLNSKNISLTTAPLILQDLLHDPDNILITYLLIPSAPVVHSSSQSSINEEQNDSDSYL